MILLYFIISSTTIVELLRSIFAQGVLFHQNPTKYVLLRKSTQSHIYEPRLNPGVSYPSSKFINRPQKYSLLSTHALEFQRFTKTTLCTVSRVNCIQRYPHRVLESEGKYTHSHTLSNYGANISHSLSNLSWRHNEAICIPALTWLIDGNNRIDYPLHIRRAVANLEAA